MTSPEWEAANEDDSDRFPQTPHASAPESTESHERGSRVVPDPARVTRYAEAIAAQQLSDHPHGFQDVAAAVMAVADEERAALVAEVERLRAESVESSSLYAQWRDDCAARAEVAEAEVERMRAILDDASGRFRESDHLIPKWAKDLRAAERRVVQLRGDVTSWQGMHREVSRRARAAEAKVAKVEALHVRIGLPEHHRTEKALAAAPDRCSTCWIDGNYAIWPCPTIAVLADAPAEQEDPCARAGRHVCGPPAEQRDGA